LIVTYILKLDLQGEIHSIWDFETNAFKKTRATPLIGRGGQQLLVKIKKNYKDLARVLDCGLQP
jgi:hypothetical protein